MNDTMKAQMYGSLLNDHRNISNKISDLKAKNFEISNEDRFEISKLENNLLQIMEQIKKLF